MSGLNKLFTSLLLLLSLHTVAQQEINVRVQVNRLPTGSYPTKVYQFNNTPNLVTVTLTNRTQNNYTLYLNGALTGDNGVKVITAKNYTPASLELKPLETKILNAIEAGNLFDPNHLVYLNGATSIKSSVFGEQGLPEGTYQVCVRAYNAASKTPLSEEDPMGCSNIFTITTLEPPVILNPFNESFIRPEPVQNIPFRWTTPPGAPPSTEYRIRIVELFNNRNPNDALFSTPNPFFETTVKGTPLLLYSMQYPRLQEGRSYAMMVIADDPLGNASFRNYGRSEVIRFTYSANTTAGNADQTGSPNTPTDYATNTLKGRLVWTFKKTEQANQVVYRSYIIDNPANAANSALANKPVSAVKMPLVANVTPYAGKAFTVQSLMTPLINFNSLAAVNQDNTLMKFAAVTSPAKTVNQSFINTVVNKPVTSLPTNIVTATMSTETSTTYENITVDSASDRYGMANTRFTLSAVYPGGGMAMLLATGQTDQDGNFSLPYLHPSFGANATPARLELSVQTKDFEQTSFRLPATIIDDKGVSNIGNLILLAKTWRFFPTVEFSASDDVNSGTYGYHIYRDAAEVEEKPWLAYEGQGNAKKNVVVVDGRRVVEIASDSIIANAGNNQLIQQVKADARGHGRIFFGGKIYVKIYPAGSSFYPISSDVSIFNASLPSNQVLVAKATYKLNVKPSHIEGRVAMFIDDQGSLPIPGASVRILYKKEDVVPVKFDLGSAVTRFADKPANSAASMIKYAGGWSNYNTNDPGTTTMQALTYALDRLGMSTTPAVLVSQPTGSSRLSGSTVVSAVKMPMLTALINPVPDDSKAVTVTTDETGSYYADYLPELKPGKSFSVEVINVPAEFRTFVIRPKAGGTSPVSVTLGKGVSKTVDFTVDADVADVVGRVVDADGKPLANARITFKGTILTQTGPEGIFQFKIYPGNHTVSLEKEGYVVKTATINVQQLTGNNSEENAYKSQWAKLTTVQKQQATLVRISQTPTVKAAVSTGLAFSAKMFGIAGSNLSTQPVATEFNASLAVAFGMAVDPKTPQYEMPRKFAVDVKDIGYLTKLTGKVRFRLVDEAAATIRIANATIKLFDTTHATDANGEWYYEGFGGATTVTILPPANSGYVAEQRTYTLTETGTEQVVTITMKKGVKIMGRVVSGTQALGNATILLDEKDFNGIVTDAQGYYTCYTTAGEHGLGARKQNYVGQDVLQTIPAAGATINFDLKGGRGKNYGTLLGFAIELSSVTAVSATQEKWSGAFINLKPVNESVFALKDNQRIPFTGITVNFDGSGNATPVGNQVKTDLTSIAFKLFGYLPVKMQTEDGVTFTKAADGSGQLNGTIQADFAAVQGYRGWSIPNTVPMLLAKTGSTSPEKLTLFSSATVQPSPITSFQLLSNNNATISGQLYGFTIVVSSGLGVDQNGVEIKGSIGTPALGPVKSVKVGINRLFLNRALAIGAVEVQTTDLPKLDIAGWKASISNLLFNEDGFKLGGNVAVYIPRSDSARINFNDLIIANTGMFGGSFVLPQGGIDLLSVANLNSGAKPLSFGRVGNSNIYRIGGSASLKINVEVLTKAFEVPLFEVMTNGDFTVQVPANYNTNIGPFGFNVSNININTKDATPFIGIQGGFSADFNWIKFEIADIKVTGSSSGARYSIEKVGVKLDVPVLKTEAFVKFNSNGFEGGGKISIAGTPIAADANFKYYKRNGGIELGANFFASIPPIPIGGLVTLDGIGGGFEYKSGGSNGGFAVDVRGKISFVGTGPVVALNPIGLTVSSAGILRGYGDLEVVSYLKMAHAEMVFNGPERTFNIQVNVDMSPIEGLAKQSLQGALVISAKPNDEFAFLGCATQVKLLGLIDNHGEFALGIRVKNPKTRGDLVSHYFEYAPEDYKRERFSGVYINTSSRIGIPKNDPFGFDLFVVSAKIWAASEYQASLLLNLEESAFRISFGGKFDAGIEACVLDIACVNISAGLCYKVEGGRNDAQGWNFGATASGNASLGFGIGIGDCDPGCNEVVTFWDGCIGGAFKVCGGAALDLNFSERNGIRFNARAASSVNDCF